MAASDPRFFLSDRQKPTFRVSACPESLEGSIGSGFDRKNTLVGSLGKLGQLDIFNKLGGGNIGKGLRTLSKLSNSIRLGDNGALNSVIGRGINTVFDTVGLNSAQLNFLRDFNPDVFNRATGAAQQIVDKIKQGNFNFEDIPNFLSDLQDLERLIGGIISSPLEAGQMRDIDLCGASPYARDLIAYAPKYKFLFIVEFLYTSPYDTAKNNNHAFVVKYSTRPNITFEYEDINYYNFRTKIPRRTVYEPMTMRFYDDDLNQAMLFYTMYLNAYSPVSNNVRGALDSSVIGVYENSGMDFENKGNTITIGGGGVPGTFSSASLGPLLGNEKVLLRAIKLYHIYRQGRLMNTYIFRNPQVASMELDDMDMAEGSTGNEVTFNFSYDSVLIIPGLPITRGNKKDLVDLTSGGLYPIDPTFGSGDAVVSDPGGATRSERGAFSNEVTVGDSQAGFGTGGPEGIASVTGTTSNTNQQQFGNIFAPSPFPSTQFGREVGSVRETLIRTNPDVSQVNYVGADGNAADNWAAPSNAFKTPTFQGSEWRIVPGVGRRT